MADGYVALDGTWRRVNGVYLAMDGVWHSTNAATVAVDGVWHNGYLPGPVVTLNYVRSANAPWTRVSYSMTAQGTWAGLRVVHRHVGGTYETAVAEWGPMTQSSVSQTNVEIAGFGPNYTYAMRIEWKDSAGRWFTSVEQELTMANLPKITEFTKSGVSSSGYTLSWAQPLDVDIWNSRNDSTSQNWTHPGNTPWMTFGSAGWTVSPNTTYYNYTRAGHSLSQQWGPWSDVQPVKTTEKTWVPGYYYYDPNSTSGTYQSGGTMAAGWQGTGRGEWYGGNGATWSSDRGHQRTAFFYDYNLQLHQFLDMGATISSAKLYIARGSGSGYSGPRSVPIALHQTTWPAAPANSSGNVYSPNVPENGGIWVDVSTHWAALVIKQLHTGFMIGDNNSATYYANYPKANTGRLEVKID